ncbi:MAG TPA: YigZ family protein [Dinghuibacter sp.]|uniref:IMPACT family protein n=1 Tax=Dinghuibacter sp. TaxID=2024697 RepID=UPI002C10C921|nr:YigZ family protein [Dinghuibacter sp.]HTJ12744.1 YigZ family protein [Dinghuibacter sp.]
MRTTYMDTYNTIEKPSMAEFKDRGSRFIAYAYPVGDTVDVKSRLQQVKKEHPKAEHHCYAYRLGVDGLQFRAGDDGEPSGSAGRPILGQIDSKGLTNTAVIVVRYFGGTLLGVPGLINAYKTATALALQLVPIVSKPVEARYTLHFDYTQLNDVMQVVRQHQMRVIEQETQLFCRVVVGIPKNRLTEALYRLGELYTVEVKAQ